MISLTLGILGWWLLLSAFVASSVWLWRRKVDHEPPYRRRRRRQARALREIPPLPRVWPARTPEGRQWP